MQYRELSSYELTVSELCFGTMRYAAKSGIPDERSSAGTQALEEAIERGVNFIHSSYEYRTRWLTGAILRKHPKRNDLHHIIKVNVPDWEEPRFDARKFRTQVETALHELSADRIAVVQHLQRGVARADITSEAGDVHRLQQFDEVTSELGEVAEKLREEGKIGAVLSFPYTVAYARRAVEAPVYSGLVAYFNPLETEMYEFFPRLEELNKDFISIRPLAGGILTDRRVERDTLPPDDRMREEKFDDSYLRLGVVRQAIGTRPLDSWQQFAFCFSLAHPVIKSTVLGINTVEHLGTALQAENNVPLDVLEKIYRMSQGFRDGE